MEVLHLLDVAYNGDKAQRTEATANLETSLKSQDGPRHLLTLIQAGVNPSLPAERSLSALLYAKNSLMYVMPDELLLAAPTIVTEIEQTLLKGVFEVSETHRRIVYECASTLISGFNWDYSSQLLPQLGKNLESIPVEQSRALLGMLYVAAKRFKTISLVPMNVKLEVCEALIQGLPGYIAYNNYHIFHLVFKLLECVVETLLQMDKVNNIPGSTLDEWFGVMADFFGNHHQAASAAAGSTYQCYIRCMKRIAMITFSVMSDATRRKRPTPIALHFLKVWAARFLDVWQQWLGFCIASEDRSAFMKSELFAIRFIKLCTLDESLYKQRIHPFTMQIIESLLFPYLCYGGDDAEVFADEENLSEFVQYMLDDSVGSGELSQRQAASNAILAMVGGKKKYHNAKAVLQQLIAVLTQGLALTDCDENYPKLFGFMQLLSIVRKYLRDIPEIWSGQMAQVLMTYVAPRCAPQVPLVALRCKAIVVCMRYSKVSMPTEQDFVSFIQMLCGLVGDTDARIRLSGIDAICTVLEIKRARPYLMPVLVPLMDECLVFLNRVQTTFVPTVILHLATHFSPELAPVMGKLGSTLVQHFLATAFDMELQEMELVNGSDMATYERAAFSADALLETIYTVVTSCSENIPAFESMRLDLIRLIRRVLEQPDCFDFMEKTLCIYLHVVSFSKPITAELWELLPLLFGVVDSGIGVDFFATIEEVLDNYISNATMEYLTNSAVMEATFTVCQKMLVGNVVCAPENQMAAGQLIEAMLHQAKGCTLQQNLFHPYLTRFATLLLQALIHPDIAGGDVRVRIWVIAALMDCFTYDAAAAINVLVETNAYPQFFEGMLYFFRGCFVDSETAAVAAPEGKKKGRGKSKKRDEAAEVVEKMSLLTRKVIILGLSSLLSFLVSPANASHACYATFTANYLNGVLSLLQYCLFTNESIYEVRCRISEENLEKIRCGEGEEDVEDVDLNDDAVLGVDGGDDTEEVYDDISEADHYDDEGDRFGLELDEADDYDSPIDDINEVHAFLQWAALMPGQPAEIQQHMQSVLRAEADFTKAATVAARYRELCMELEKAMQADYQARTNPGTAVS